MEKKFEKIKEIVSERLKDCSAHDIEHVERVYNLCLYLAKDKKTDLEVLKIAALLHDIGGLEEINDPTGQIDHAVVGAEMAGSILKDLGFSKNKIEHIQDCIISHRYKNKHEPKTIEAKILFDADKLDALGAIGLARGFVWVGRNKAKIYSKPNLEEYIKDNLVGGKTNGRIKDKTMHSPQIEFETKWKFIKDRLHTKEAKELAQKRIEYSKSFLDKLENEATGEIYGEYK
jgi:uncharacterized protein